MSGLQSSRKKYPWQKSRQVQKNLNKSRRCLQMRSSKALKTVTIKTKKLTKVGSAAFKGIAKKAVIKLPKAKKTAYT